MPAPAGHRRILRFRHVLVGQHQLAELAHVADREPEPTVLPVRALRALAFTHIWRFWQKPSTRSVAGVTEHYNLTPYGEAVFHGQSGPIGNTVLDSVPPSALEAIAPHLRTIELERRQPLYEPDDVILRVYFPVSCAASWLGTLPSGGTIELATVGSEGIVGVPVVYGERRSPFRIINQVPGEALELETAIFEQVLRDSVEMRTVAARYLDAFILQLGQSSACNALHSVGPRTAKWLLMTQDRVKRDEWEMTHELLAEMLGVSRPTVSEAMGELQTAGAIQSTWGHIRVVDRRRLEAASCECYGIIANAYARLAPP